VVPLDVRPVFGSGEFEVFVSATQFPSCHFAQLQGSPYRVFPGERHQIGIAKLPTN
jgi:hypothetical protein